MHVAEASIADAQDTSFLPPYDLPNKRAGSGDSSQAQTPERGACRSSPRSSLVQFS